jgi:hypothetical protein
MEKPTPDQKMRACEMYGRLCSEGHTHEGAVAIVRSSTGMTIKAPVEDQEDRDRHDVEKMREMR